jgi:hypothetical protein
MADVSTEVAIATQTLGSAASSITFSSIPSTYTDLRLVLVCKSTSSTDMYVRFNADNGSNYSVTTLAGNGTTAYSFGATSQTQIDPNVSVGALDTTIPSLITFDIFSYAGSTYKTVLITTSQDYNGSGSAGGTGSVNRNVALWRSTSAITSLNLAGAANFAAGTTATLYGIL